MATLHYKNDAAIHKFTEILLPNNSALTIPIGEMVNVSDEIAELIPDNIPYLTVILGGEAKGQTAQAVIKQLADYSGMEEVEAKAAEAREEAVEKAKATAKSRKSQTQTTLSSETPEGL